MSFEPRRAVTFFALILILVGITGVLLAQGLDSEHRETVVAVEAVLKNRHEQINQMVERYVYEYPGSKGRYGTSEDTNGALVLTYGDPEVGVFDSVGLHSRKHEGITVLLEATTLQDGEEYTLTGTAGTDEMHVQGNIDTSGRVVIKAGE